MSVFGLVVLIVLLLVLGLYVRQWADRRAAQAVSGWLVEHRMRRDGVFDSTLTEGLPEPARRYFSYMIEEGAPLVTVVEIDMEGELGLAATADPKYQSMRAHQVLSPPVGLVWRLKTGALHGSDGVTPETSWTRFWLYHLLPVVRVGGSVDHRRSAFGRVVSEAAIWVPASLLPSECVRWEAVNHETARAVVSYAGFEQAVNITVSANGEPTQVVISRWSNENSEREYREQPFGGNLSEFREFGGYRLPTRVVGGNHIGTDEYFPFYRASVVGICLPEVKPGCSNQYLTKSFTRMT